MKIKLILIIILLSISFPGLACATLLTIGTATYGGSDYKLIWDDDNNGNSVVWLDFTNTVASWSEQIAWATGLDTELTYNIEAAFKLSWSDDAWRLGETVDKPYVFGNDGTTTAGYGITSSEMGHLFYEDLGNLAYLDAVGAMQPGFGLQSTADFDNLVESYYWSGTEYSGNADHAWTFSTEHGYQGLVDMPSGGYGLAVRSGQVSVTTPVPEPSTFLLLGAGLGGLALCRRRAKKVTDL